MDDVVQRAMAKWPDVPAVFGWLALDRRGQWLIKNERVSNSLLTAFIGRNYDHDSDGRWYFQNGPQRVFVALAYVPWVLRMADTGTLRTHTLQPIRHIKRGWIDEQGVVLFETEYGGAMVDDRDIEALSLCFVDVAGNALDDDALLDALERTQIGGEPRLVLRYAEHAVALHPISSGDVPARLGFVADPQPAAGEPAIC